ncbi:MAG: hypothetical protein ACQSGP_18785 [Frankia sp.]
MLTAAREQLELVDGLPVAEHAEIYEVLHGLLSDALSDIDAPPGS